MNILIDNVNTANKGAELMLYAVLQELERKQPNATVWLPLYGIPEGTSYIKTSMNCKQRKVTLAGKFLYKVKGDKILRKVFNIPYSYSTDSYPIKGLDLILDAGGYNFTDKFKKSKSFMSILYNKYKAMKKQKTNIIFLPQAFGPFETKNGKDQVKLLEEYADHIFAREEESYNNLINAGVDRNKISLYPDFTCLAEGVFPSEYAHLKNGIAIIPNARMLDKSTISKGEYIEVLSKIITICRSTGRVIFLLSHEGEGDNILCRQINDKLHEKVPIVKNLSALKIKGLISQCYFVFSSRFHGLVSSLNSGVPCIATSWSHKYEMLFKDYNMDGWIFDFNNKEVSYQRLKELLNIDYNKRTKADLILKAESIKTASKIMWEHVWTINTKGIGFAL